MTSRGGKRDGAGRKAGGKNKATIEQQMTKGNPHILTLLATSRQLLLQGS